MAESVEENLASSRKLDIVCPFCRNICSSRLMFLLYVGRGGTGRFCQLSGIETPSDVDVENRVSFNVSPLPVGYRGNE